MGKYDNMGLSPQEIQDMEKLDEEEAILERKNRLKYWSEKSKKDKIIEERNIRKKSIISITCIVIFLVSIISVYFLSSSTYSLNSYDKCSRKEKYEIVNIIKPIIEYDLKELSFDFYLFDSPSDFKLSRLKGNLWQLIVGFSGRIGNNRDRYVAVYTFTYENGIVDITNIQIKSRIRVLKNYNKDGISWGERLLRL